MEIINYIARTNLFNFAIFLAILVYLYKKLNVTGMFERSKVEVEHVIEESKTVKSESEVRLNSVEESLSHIEDEIESILKKSEENANLVGVRILEDAEKNSQNIRHNTLKSIENSHNILKNDLVKRASEASVEVAKNHIINELNNNQWLHDKLIDESIEAIEGVQL